MKLFRCLMSCALLGLVSSASAVTNTLIFTGSFWLYLDDGSNQGTNWTKLGFNDGSWSLGQAELGYGDGDEITPVRANRLDGSRIVTTYFRHNFELNDPESYTVLRLRVKRDDGVAVYLNGTLVFRDNLTNNAGYVTLATNAPDDGSIFLSTTINPVLLIPGDNVLAAEIHQADLASSDISFDLELLGSTDPIANNLPSVAITSPGNNAFFTQPANIPIRANASDPDGNIVRVEFFRSPNIKLGEDTLSPFTFDWNGVGSGNYQLTAVATDNLNGRGTSAVVNVSVGISTPPTISSIVPGAGTVSSLSQVAVTFSEAVSGVDANDLLINGIPASSVTASNNTYIFRFPQPAVGTVYIAWNGTHGILDFESPPKAFDQFAAGGTWQYTLNDTVAPIVVEIDPRPGATVNQLAGLEVTFSESVSGVNAGDLLVNGIAATGVNGSGAGPYRFSFNQPADGTANLSWAGGHGIKDFAASPNAFAGGSWSYTLSSGAVFAGAVVINEIMFNPSGARVTEEYIELFNRGSTAVNLTGWRLNRGVDFTFPNTNLPAGGYLVVAANVGTFRAKYPSVANVIGSWSGRLSNSGEDIELEDASGNRVDLVQYADQGDWAVRVRLGATGWDWRSDADALGRSLELINAALPNEFAHNWAPSTVNNGTPGFPNSVASSNARPMISEVSHFPPVPKSSESVTVRARVVDETAVGLAVTLRHRDAAVAPAFSTTQMFDDGAHNDGAAGDGIYAAVLSPLANQTIVEFYIEASDGTGNSRAWPLQLNDGNVEGNAYFQVDNENYTGTQPLYRLIMRPVDRDAFFNQFDRIPRNATFITVEGSDVEIRYLCDVRRRGASSFSQNPPTFKLNIPRDRLWNGKSSINMNSASTWAQVIGAAISLRAGLPAAPGMGVQFRVNGRNESDTGSRMFGSYAAMDVLNDEWADSLFPDDGEGNVYSKRRPECFLEYRGTDPQAYINCAYDKESNGSENDWSDLINLMAALDPDTTPDNEYVAAVRRNVNVELWMRYFAVLHLMHYNETALVTGADDDYSMYRGVVDPRFMVLPHDLDSIFGSQGQNGDGIYRPTSIPNLARFLFHPEFEPLYHAEYRRQLAGMFSTNQLFPLFDQLLTGWVPSGTIDSMKSIALTRINNVLAQLTPEPTTVRATISGEPISPTALRNASLTVGGTDITHYRYRLNNGTFGPETPVATPISLSSLANGTYTVYVIGRNASGVYQDQSSPTISKTWTVIGSLANVVINEVLARNDSLLNHNGTFPDVIELFNQRNTAVDLSGLRLTDDPSQPSKFTFAAGTSIPANGYLLVYGDDPHGGGDIHVGFALSQNGEGLYLFDRATNGGALLDSVVFGNQLANVSIGRNAAGRWTLTTPTLGSANTPRALGNVANLRINEWLADGTFPYVDDFIEIYNPNALPVDLGGLFLTDNPIGAPARHQIAPLHFVDGLAYSVFIADGNADAGADHVNFSLAVEFGQIGLFNSGGEPIDSIYYDQQRLGVTEGRVPNGGARILSLTQPTPGIGNPTPPEPPQPITVTLLPLNDTHLWRYEESGTDLTATPWKQTSYNDSSWPQGAALLGFLRNGGTAPPEPIRTGNFTIVNGKTAFYFRSRFNLPAGQNFSALEVRHIIDDGAVFYINGQEAGRYNMPSGPVSFGTTAANNVLDATWGGPTPLSMSSLVPGENVIAVEVHQATTGSADIMFGIELRGVIFTNPPSAAGLVINEVLANNSSIEEADGSAPDWIEIYNPSNAGVDLADASLTDDLVDPRRWVFPAGSVVPAQGYLRIRFDSGAPAIGLNTGFGLDAAGDSVYLINKPAAGGELLDSISFGLQAPNYSIGRVPNGSTNWVLTVPTASAANLAPALGDPLQLRVNEWLANPAPGEEDWFEIYNPNAQPVALGGLLVTDDLNNLIKHPIPALSFIGTGLRGFQRFEADSNPAAGANHVNFGLRAAGESLGIATAGGILIHGTNFGAQAVGVSQGFLPDGSTTMVLFPGTATPGESNFLPIPNVVINEVLSHSDLPLEDAIELRNTSGVGINIGGWFLSDEQSALKKYQIPAGTTLPANGFKVFYETNFNPVPNDPGSFALSSARGDQVYLSAASAGGVLTGYRVVVDFDAAENGVSFGRYVTSDNRSEFVAMSAHTFGVPDPSTVTQFRTGQGAPNAYPKVGPVVISEIMYHPPDINGIEDDVVNEYIQLQNITAQTVPLFDPLRSTNRWRLRGGVDFDFPPNRSLSPGGSLLVVSFDPVADPATLAAFRAKYGLGTNTVILGPYAGRLDNGGETVRLSRPDVPETDGFVPYIVVERIGYSDSAPWPVAPDGFGSALRRVDLAQFGNDPINWVAGMPLGSGGGDSDGDGMPDDWEYQYALEPQDPTDADEDKDSDGMSNLDEYRSGTNPIDSTSVLEVQITYSGAAASLSFLRQANKSYTVQFQTTLGGTWQTLQQFDALPSSQQVVIPITPTGAPRFYRVRTPRLP